MDGHNAGYRRSKKKQPVTERGLTTALFLLRCTELGLSMSDLDYLDVGMIFDMFIEKSNDAYDWAILATEDDIEAF